MPQTVRLQVGSVKCSQSSISSHFQSGEWIGHLIHRLKSGDLHPNELEIRVIDTDDGYYCLDHRRMWCVREGCSHNLWFKVIVDQDWDEFNYKNTSKNEGRWPTFVWPTGSESDDDDDDDDDAADSDDDYDDDDDNSSSSYYDSDDDVASSDDDDSYYSSEDY